MSRKAYVPVIYDHNEARSELLRKELVILRLLKQRALYRELFAKVRGSVGDVTAAMQDLEFYVQVGCKDD